MAPFASNGVMSKLRMPIDHEPAADASSQDHAENSPVAMSRPVLGFRKGKAVGIVLYDNGPWQARLQIAME